MHHPRCLEPKSQDGSIPHPYPYDGGCRLGGPGHCRKCPHRGQDDSRVARVMEAASYASHRPDTEFTNGKMPEWIAEFLWPLRERRWIEEQEAWAERAAYHVAVAKNELIRELLREIHGEPSGPLGRRGRPVTTEAARATAKPAAKSLCSSFAVEHRALLFSPDGYGAATRLDLLATSRGAK